ncbi:MAG: helix-turn-helix domain-containing protein [Rhodopseudomonas palustris]|nr:MAG: helix-turn-helix domain-containing protein [Rhodopseudomonas palustris]
MRPPSESFPRCDQGRGPALCRIHRGTDVLSSVFEAYRFNQHGPDGLIDIKPPGRRPRLSDDQKQVLKQLVEDGPDPETDGVVRWRCVDLKRVGRDRFGVELSEVSLGRVLKQLGFSRIRAFHVLMEAYPALTKKLLHSSGRTFLTRWPMWSQASSIVRFCAMRIQCLIVSGARTPLGVAMGWP